MTWLIIHNLLSNMHWNPTCPCNKWEANPAPTHSNTTYSYFCQSTDISQKASRSFWYRSWWCTLVIFSRNLFCSILLITVKMISIVLYQSGPIVYSRQEFYTKGFSIAQRSFNQINYIKQKLALLFFVLFIHFLSLSMYDKLSSKCLHSTEPKTTGLHPVGFLHQTSPKIPYYELQTLSHSMFSQKNNREADGKLWWFLLLGHKHAQLSFGC